jgi:hypothetical protein
VRGSSSTPSKGRTAGSFTERSLSSTFDFEKRPGSAQIRIATYRRTTPFDFIVSGSGDVVLFPGSDFIRREFFQWQSVNCRGPGFASAVAVVVPGAGLGHRPDFGNDEPQTPGVILEGLVPEIAFASNRGEEIADGDVRRFDRLMQPRSNYGSRYRIAVFGKERDFRS